LLLLLLLLFSPLSLILIDRFFGVSFHLVVSSSYVRLVLKDYEGALV